VLLAMPTWIYHCSATSNRGAKMLVTFRLSALGFGGTERVFISIADFLSSTYGWSIDFVVDKNSGHETEQITNAKGYRIISLGKSRTWETILPFANYLKTHRPDVIISAYTETNAAALVSNMLQRFHTPHIVTEHASLDEHWAGKPWLRRMMLEFIVRYIYKFADQVLCVSQGMAEQLGKRLKHAHISFIHNPVRFSHRTQTKIDARKMLKIAENTHMLLAVGRISRQKNYLMLLQSVKLLDPSSKYCLCIVGGVFDQEEKLKLDQFITDNNLAEQVRFVDFTHDIHSYYEAADIFVLSSAWEGFGNVLVEALAFGLPIVSTRCNYGPAEILDNGQFGILVDVNDHTAMGQAIQHVMTVNSFNSDQQIGRAQNFTEQRIGANYYQLICQTIGSLK
jgi:glycosyltransferase involved in cell wall biosynthesis